MIERGGGGCVTWLYVVSWPGQSKSQSNDGKGPIVSARARLESDSDSDVEFIE